MGMGGGIILLIGMNVVYPLNICVPIHGLIQFGNNGFRVYKLKSFIRFKICLFFVIGALLGVLFLFRLFKLFNLEIVGYLCILTLCLYTVFKPKKLSTPKLNQWGFFTLGIITGSLGMVIGATGPLLAPFFLREEWSQQEIVANKSFCQFVIHFLKFPFFISLGFEYFSYKNEIIILVLGGFIGSYIGVKLLSYIEKEKFVFIYKTILFFVSLRLLYKVIFVI